MNVEMRETRPEISGWDLATASQDKTTLYAHCNVATLNYGPLGYSLDAQRKGATGCVISPNAFQLVNHCRIGGIGVGALAVPPYRWILLELNFSHPTNKLCIYAAVVYLLDILVRLTALPGKSSNYCYLEMASDGLKTFQLQLEDYRPNAATLRTDIAPSAGTAKGPGFYVDFKIVYEVHGGFEPPDRDNASLLVIRIVPFPKDIERQFLSFSVKLSVQAAAEKKRQSTFHDDDNDENKMPQFRSFEPASQGQQFVDVYTTNETRERMAQLNGQVPIMQAASFGGQLSATNKSEFTRTHILKVSSREERDDLEVPHNVYNRVAWTISAANKDQGIGDSFTVALLVKRPPGSRFRLAAEVDGDVGSFLAKTKKFVSLGIGGKKPPTLLASFPSHPSNQKVPRGVDVGDLHRASTDNVMRDIKEVGLHLPEQANPVKVNQGEFMAFTRDKGGAT